MVGAPKVVLLFCMSACLITVLLADKEEIRDGDQQDLRSDNETKAFSAETGPPDSHEAMNNREMPSKFRGKRSYEFLMGLINNNSRYEVTKVDPSKVATQKPEVATTDIAASELLLELMVRIAAHPDQWDKVHKLLQMIEEDLSTSRSVVDNIKTKSVLTKTKENANEVNGDDGLSNNIEKKKASQTKTLESADTSVKFVNSSRESNQVEKNAGDVQKMEKQTSTLSPYHKNFAYHRVTGTPFNLNKGPKAYIAVSVIAPKSSTSTSKEDDIALENELHQLNKPWSHSQNLKNMESIRSRWLIQTEEKPSL